MRRTRRSHAALTAFLAAALLANGRARAQTAPPPETAPAAQTPPTPPPPPAAPTPPAPPTPPAAPPPATPPPGTSALPPGSAIPPPGYATPPPGYAYPPPGYAYPPTGYAYPPPGYAYPYPSSPPIAAIAESPEVLARGAASPSAGRRAPADDPQADRGVLMPTAYTHPKGTLYVTDYEVAFLQLGYALTDDTQLTLSGVPPLGNERVLFLDVTLKSTLYRGGRVRVAALGSTTALAANEIGLVGVGRVGGVVQVCFDARRCDSSLSLSSDLTLAGALLMANGATGIFRLSRAVSLLAELDTLVPLGKDVGEINGGLGAGGVRFHWPHWGFDLSLLRVLGSNRATLPFVAVTYRSSP